MLSKGGIEETLNLANKASPEMEEKDRRLHFMAQIIDGSLEKSKIFGHPLTPALQYIDEEFGSQDGIGAALGSSLTTDGLVTAARKLTRLGMLKPWIAAELG